MPDKTKRAREKASGGLGDVLFIRVPKELIDRIDRLVEKRRAEEPWRAVSRSDVARELLYAGTEGYGS